MNKAYKILSDGNYTCVLCMGEAVFTSTERGVKSLLEWIESGKDFRGFAAADKVVGKAAAFLYVIMGVSSVYAKVMSEPAKAVLEKNGIAAYADNLTTAIRNRTGTGFCPMESAVMGVDSPDTALEVIKNKLEELSGNADISEK